MKAGGKSWEQLGGGFQEEGTEGSICLTCLRKGKEVTWLERSKQEKDY